MRNLVLAISIGLLAACGETASAPGNDTAKAPTSSAPVESATDGTADTAADSPAKAAATATPAADSTASVAGLPLKRGYYVSSDTSCARASNATLSLLRQDGLGGSRDFCEFVKIEKTGATSYRITEKCGDLQGGPDSEFTQVAVWTIPNDTSFSRKSDSGWESSARYCAQSSLPDPWRDNDISDIVK